jgi:hypothetical protein
MNTIQFFVTLLFSMDLSKSVGAGSRWKVKALNYKISKYPKNLNPREVDKEIHRAFSVWSKYTDLTFTPSKGNAHIDIRFESGEHGDGDPFDGPGGTLAHAYFPVRQNHSLVISVIYHSFIGVWGRRSF